MKPIAVVTDSTATIPEELLKKYTIYVAPLHIIWDKIKYRDGIDIKPEEFYTRLRTSGTLPTTSGAIQGEYIQIFEELRGRVDGIVCMVLSKELSAAYSSALIAKETITDIPVEIIDSRISTMGMGFGVIAAAKKAEEGGTIEQVAKVATDIFSKIHVYFILDTLDYLRRGGRVNFPSALIANLLKVKPILTLKNGVVEPSAKPRTRQKAFESIIDLMKEKITSSPLHVALMDADDPAGIKELKSKITSNFQCTELVTTAFTPVMGTHTGPNLIGVAFYNE
jgi:DegV family protein with EDD domain